MKFAEWCASDRCWLVVVGIETWRRWNPEAIGNLPCTRHSSFAAVLCIACLEKIGGAGCCPSLSTRLRKYSGVCGGRKIGKHWWHCAWIGWLVSNSIVPWLDLTGPLSCGRTKKPTDPDGFGEEVIDTVSTARLMATPQTPTKFEQKERDAYPVLLTGLESRHFTQDGDRNDDRSRMVVDYGKLNDAIIHRTTHYHDVHFGFFQWKNGGDPHTTRQFAKWIDNGCVKKPRSQQGRTQHQYSYSSRCEIGAEGPPLWIKTYSRTPQPTGLSTRQSSRSGSLWQRLMPLWNKSCLATVMLARFQQRGWYTTPLNWKKLHLHNWRTRTHTLGD